MVAISTGAPVSNQPGKWVAILEAIRSLKSSCSVKATAFALHSYLGSKDHAWPSVATLSADTGLSPRSVQRAVRKLVEVGLLVVEGRTRRDGSHTSNIYRFQVSPPPATVTPLEEKPNPKDISHARQGHDAQKQEVKSGKRYSIPAKTFSKITTAWNHYRIAVTNRWCDSSEATLVDYVSSWNKCHRLHKSGKCSNPGALMVWVIKQGLLSKFPTNQDENAGQRALKHLRSTGCGYV